MISLRHTLGLLSLAASAFGAPPDTRPNVLFIVVDDLRTNLGCYGDPAALTPAIDALAARSVRFNAAYCQQAVCNPSRASLFTGRRPDSLRVWDLATHFRQTTPSALTLPQHFQQHGYFTAAIGKLFHDGAKMADPASWSVPALLDAVPKREDYQRPENQREGRGNKAAALEFAAAPASAYPDGRVADAALDLLTELARTPQRRPFFLAVGFRKPHLPFTAPQLYWDRFADRPIPAPAVPHPPSGAPPLALHDSIELRGYSDLPARGDFTPVQISDLRRAYYAATAFTDAQIGRVLAALHDSGLQTNTIVVLLSDHGFHLGEHGLWVKTTNYEADTRVPLLIAQPDARQRGVSTEALTELLDLFPTLADLCGLPVPAALEGRSLRPWLEDPSLPGRPAVFSQFPRPWLLRRAPQHMGYAVRTTTHRYVEWRDWTTGAVHARELYALEYPGEFERENLCDRPAEQARVRALSALLPAPTPHAP